MWHWICNVYYTDVLYRAPISALIYYTPVLEHIIKILFSSYNTSILELVFFSMLELEVGMCVDVLIEFLGC